MKNNKINSVNPRHTSTVHLSLAEHTTLMSEAEKRGTNRSNLLRLALIQFLENQTLDEKIREMETRLNRQIFEIVCAVGGLTNEERKQAFQEVRHRLQEVRV